MAQKTTPISFLYQVRAEASRVFWPSRKETLISSGMVVLMSFLAAVFFFIADQFMSYGIEVILGLGR
jgi:preprotein translocase subunit SecE